MTDSKPIGFWLKLVDRMIDEQFASTLEEHGVTRRQWQLMNVLALEPSTVEQLDAAVAPFLVSSASGGHETSAEHLTELIDSGWVDATPDGYELTGRGRIAFEKLEALVAAQRTLATEGVTPAEYEQTVSVLERIARNLGWRD
ncbi:DNA-binding MarR family transcriptional regulator [Microbacteriaceae bacterium SG_E_30_P1]|uniref:DNA-binding MarR family transcriptional regulator n=1 Tax=Antiquaquibacter oligotrophicus TaxID=2880260 RepID=A0ABT6KR60_9MICO|nr:MarR family winged helix-turn-helix transcriptional regulator [Antiquaquibacter oligotrophicus]MDH6182474.1 DNA-binding MarR family transcriptional regulator [Antiquaquibacter oligotrophicus]UDF14556.1 MarR family winged helix-turn-helix transcriptional regulator [Antiquaquibacter oligotrophicus]